MNIKKTKTTMILKYLKSGKTLTQIQCYKKFNCIRLSAIVYNIRKLNGKRSIITIPVKDKNGGIYGKYK